MLKCSTILIAVLLFSPPISARGTSHPYYAFVLPDGYIGWIQIIFNDPHATQLHWEQNAVFIEVPDCGVVHTSSFRVHAPSDNDRFFYRVQLPNGRTSLVSMPNDYLLKGIDHGGFGYIDTDGKGPGYSWFIFVGPPQLRAKTPIADWAKVVEEYRRAHNGNSRVEQNGPLPVPGRITSGSK